MEFFLHVLIKGTSILSLSLIVLFLSRKASASFKHWLIGMTLISLLLLPLCVSILPSWQIPLSSESMNLLLPKETSALQATPMGLPELSTGNLPASVPPPEMVSAETPPPINKLKGISLAYIFLMVWGLVSLLLMVKLVLDLLKMRRITLAALPFERGQQLLSEDIKVLISEEVKTPMTWGLSQSYILFPKLAKGWSDELLKTILTHEQAHIQRKDFWIHTIAIVSANVYWWHPFVWIFKNRLSVEREKACDEKVLSEGLNSSNYAASLLQVTKQLINQPQLAALPLAKKSELKSRVQAILDFSRSTFSFSKVKQIQWAGIYVSLAMLLAVVTPIEKLNALQPFNTQMLNAFEVELPPLPLKQETPKPQKRTAIPEKETISSLDEAPVKEVPVLEIAPIKSAQLQVESNQILALEAPKITNEKKAYFRKVIRKNSEYNIWIFGNYQKLGGFPYYEVENPGDMIIIEEQRSGLLGNREFLLIITKAPFKGVKINVSPTNENSFYSQGPYEAGEELYFFLKNEKWVIDRGEKIKWMNEHLQTLRWIDYNKSDEELFEPIDQDHPMIQQQQKYIQLHFLPRTKKEPQTDLKEETEPDPETIRERLNEIPYKEQIGLLRETGNLRKFGRIKPNKTTSGSTSIEIGQRFGTVIPRVPEGQLIDLRFHVRYNNYEKIDFALSLYQIEGETLHRINSEAITFSADNKNPWIKVPLESHQIGAKGDIMAVLEIQDLVDEDGDGHLFFSQSDMLFRTFNRKFGKEYGFWDGNFAFYFTVRE